MIRSRAGSTPVDSAPARSARADSPGAASAEGVRNPWERFGWLMAVVWLIFLAYPVLALWESTAPLPWLVLGWAALIAFGVLYVIGFIRGLRGAGGLGVPPSRQQWVIFFALIVCAALTIPAVGGNALSFLPFIMAFASYGLTRVSHWATFIASLIVTAVAVVVLPDGEDYLMVLAIIGLLGVVNTVSTWLIIRSAEAERLGLELATSEGREAVARDVHDLIGHSLTVVQLKAQLAARLIDVDPARAKAEIADVAALTAEALAGVRSTVSGARATTLAGQLASSREGLDAAGISLRIYGEPASLSPAQALTAAWILREATTNVLRHAHASSVAVVIEPGLLRIEDDGRGVAQPEGSGVRGMRDRAAAAGAGLVIRPRGEGGTQVEVAW